MGSSLPGLGAWTEGVCLAFQRIKSLCDCSLQVPAMPQLRTGTRDTAECMALGTGE